MYMMDTQTLELLEKQEAREKEIFLRKTARLKKIKDEKTHQSNLRKFRKYNEKIRQAMLKSRAEIGDSRDTYTILIAENHDRWDCLGWKPWKTDAYAIFTSNKEQNKSVKFPKEYMINKKGKPVKVLYEILMVKHVDPILDTNTSYLKNDYGQNTEIRCDNAEYMVIDRAKWNIEEDFYVYGFDHESDRKDFNFILNELLLKPSEKFEIKQVYYYSNKVFIKSDAKIDIVICKCKEDAKRLLKTLDKHVIENYRYIFFNHKEVPFTCGIIQDVLEQTGWNKNLLDTLIL